MLGLRHPGRGIRFINSGVAMSSVEAACCSPKSVSRARCQLESTFCSTIRRFLPIQMISICASLNSYVQNDDCFFPINVRISHVSISQISAQLAKSQTHPGGSKDAAEIRKQGWLFI